jgi:hypothetical protein
LSPYPHGYTQAVHFDSEAGQSTLRLSSSLIVSAIEVRRLRKDLPSVTQKATVIFLSEAETCFHNEGGQNYMGVREQSTKKDIWEKDGGSNKRPDENG